MKTNSFLFSMMSVVLATTFSCSSGGGGGSKGPISGAEKYIIAFYDQETRNEDNDDWDWDGAYDEMKSAIEEHLTAAMGKPFATNVSADAGTLESPFAVTYASGNVGRSTADPFVILSAKLRSSKSSLGYICRDGKGLPVAGGISKIEDGEMEIALVFEYSALNDYCIAVNRELSSVVTIDVMDENEFENHVVKDGEGWNYTRGFGGIYIGGKLTDIPDELPGIYDKKETSNYVLDGVENTQVALRGKGKDVAIVKGNDKDGINYMEILSPELFIVPDYDIKGRSLLHCNSDGYILLYAGGCKTSFESDEKGAAVPIAKVKYAYFKGLEINNSKSAHDRSFYYEDIVSGTRAKSLILK